MGRPNVGKSTLFNRLLRKRVAIVDAEAGVTRDRKYEEVEWNGCKFIMVDTGGIVPNSEENFDKAIKFQANIAIDEADFILFVVDAHTGTTSVDVDLAKMLRPYREKVMLVANKVDNEKFELDIYDFLQLGFDDAFPVSAAHGRNTGNFLDALVSGIDTVVVKEDEEKEKAEDIKIAVIGKPNVGKSSIINRLLGEEKHIVTEIAGTTRDAVDSKMKYHGRDLTFIDTAGLRRKKNIKYGIEYYSNMRTISSINRSDIAILVLNSEEKISVQDKKIASYAYRHYRDIVIVANKWDLIEKDNRTHKKFTEEIRHDLPFLNYAPIIFTSAETGQRVRKILDLALEVYDESQKRIPTAELNKFLERVVGKFPPSHSSGKHVKIYFMTQVSVHPPTFVCFTNAPEHITTHYKRYLHNQLREYFKFTGATVKLKFKGRKSGDEN
ncbi:MAG: ribosome biogenesis GTPase Der [Candidatus Cloacimonadota bacterium]|nr:MAG: ribosome biogenesis GTPase Der [Candidatus Cloacimonadota bacterium]